MRSLAAQATIALITTALTLTGGGVATAAPVVDDPAATESPQEESLNVVVGEYHEVGESEAVSSTSSDGAPPPPPPQAVVYPPPPPQAPPPVYRPQERRRSGLGMMIAGWSIFAASYGLTALAGAALIDSCDGSSSFDCRRLGRSLMIPVLGPFIATPQISSMSGRFAMVVFPGLAQVTGLSLGIAGSVLFARSRRNPRIAAVNHDGLRLSRRHNTLRLANLATPAGGGLRLSYRF